MTMIARPPSRNWSGSADNATEALAAVAEVRKPAYIAGMGVLTEYHLAWLADHPYRTEHWLRERLAEGFDIHHLDGDHSNNAPLNLVLIEHIDHIRLHGGNVKLGRLAPNRNKRVRRKGRRALERAKRNIAALDSLLAAR